MWKLNIEIAFTDKIKNVDYTVGDVIEVDEARANELLADSRKLVSLNSKPEETITSDKNESDNVQVDENKPEEVVDGKKDKKNKNK